jgi:probable rRNA maturation factor
MPVLIRNRLRRYFLLDARLQSIAQRILREAGNPDAELSLELVGDARMRQLNRRYRRVDRSTDVLAFPMAERRGLASSLLGDVVISLHTAARQATAEERSLDHEVVILLIHGVVHLLGYDHERSRKEARRMYRKERALYEALQPLPKLLRQT